MSSNINKEFINAVRNSDENTVLSLLLTNKVNINGKEKPFGDTPLICAVGHNHGSMASLLLDRGADANIKNKYGETALMSAVSRNHESMVSLLLDRGANINIRNDVSITFKVFYLYFPSVFYKFPSYLCKL